MGKRKPLGISVRAGARALGVSAPAVQKAIENGRVRTAVLADGTLHLPTLKREWVANADPTKGALGGNKAGTRVNGAAGGVTLHDARVAREAFNAKLAELEYRRRVGELLDAAEVLRLIDEATRRLRDRLESIPARLAPVVAGMSGQDDCYRAIETEIHQALDELSALPENAQRH